MVHAFDRIVFTVPAVAEAGALYRQLLGVEPCNVGSGDAPRLWFPLPNTVIELEQGSCDSPYIKGIVMAASEPGSRHARFVNARGLDICLDDGTRTAALRKQREALPEPGLRVDHLVLRTADAQECIDLFGGQLGLRLALDKTVPEWGGRMLFFRTGKITLEVIEPEREKPPADHFWGIAFQCPDLGHTARELAARGVSLSTVRKGRKPGTLVATVKSHCLGIPTLLLQPG